MKIEEIKKIIDFALSKLEQSDIELTNYFENDAVIEHKITMNNLKSGLRELANLSADLEI
jgi:hypothetical protein